MFELNEKNYAKAARQAVAEGCVLLKNEGGVLPLVKGTKTAVFGIGAFYYLNYIFSYIAPFSVTCVFSCPSLFKLSSFSSVTLSILEIDTSYAIFLTTSVSLIFF